MASQDSVPNDAGQRRPNRPGAAFPVPRSQCALWRGQLHALAGWWLARPAARATILLVHPLFQLTGRKPLVKDQTPVALER